MPGVDDATPTLSRFLPADRAHALLTGTELPPHAHGTVLFADIGGFTAMAEAVADSIGSHGAEEVATRVHVIFDALAEAVDRHHGSIVAFAGDAITCWFDDGHMLGAVACALEMQEGMEQAGQASSRVAMPTLGLKIALAEGDLRRAIVGDPELHVFDALIGTPVDLAGEGEKHCRTGEVLIHRDMAESLGETVEVDEERGDFLRVKAVGVAVVPDPWSEAPAGAVADDAVGQWVDPDVRRRLLAGHEQLLAEFRPVVVMFVSLDGADATHTVVQLDASVRSVQEIAGRCGGSVLNISIGDKGTYLLVSFGAPVAHGDDLRRAVTAAQEIREQGGAAVRIGVHEGRVFAGLYQGRVRCTYTILGDVVNVAARLMTAAAPGQVLMTAHVGAALDRRFLIQALEPVYVKGRVAPVAVCALVGDAARDVTLSEPRHALPVVGRDRELALIDRAVADTKAGHGGVLACSADAGLGKSRLVSEAILQATTEGFATFAGECRPEGAGIAYLPWRPIWNGLLGLPVPSATEDARRNALLGTLEHAAPEAAPLAPLLGTVLDLPIEDTDATRDMPAPVRKQVLEQLLTGVLRGRAAAGPVCIVIEDVHWADALSRDLMATLAASIADVPVLLLLAYRPHELDRWIDIPAGHLLELRELPDEAASQLVSTLLSQATADEPDPSTVATIVERADGNPFFIEELVREVGERGGRVSDLPTTVEHLILERIDRLPATQQGVAKVASVIGRRFHTAWLTGAFDATLDPTRIEPDLAGLATAGLTVADTPPPDESYIFRHVVVRDVVYETLGSRLRESLHERLAEYLERTAAAPPVELLAYHYARSANAAKEAEYRRLAAEVAIRNGAYADALDHVQRASAIVGSQPDSPEKLEQDLELSLMLGTILLVIDGQGSEAAKAAYDHARELSSSLPPGPAVARAVFGLWTYYLFQGLMGPTAELADEAVALTAHSPDQGVRIMAHLAVSQTHMWTGQWDKCVEHYDRVLELYDPTEHQQFITQYAQNPRFTASNSAFWAEWMRGRPETARAVADLAIDEARELDHAFTYTIAFLGRPLVAWFRRDNDTLLGSVEEYVATAERAGNPFYIALARSMAASAEVVDGRAAAGLAGLEEQFAAMHALGSKLCDPLMVSLLGEAYLAAERFDDGLKLIDTNIERFRRDGQVSSLSDHLRLRAELLLRLDPSARSAALALFDEARAMARSHGALSLELRCALSAWPVLCAAGRREEAVGDLSAAYDRFTEAFDDADLREARALLAS